ncbi:Molybdopterin binding protein [Microstroma glucosiphilum]|uniref:Molybdopterin binding protein n=1 Tax=Pseudomicrostroma glucosiphilum TaxID=1684307 RepID=A0A316TZP2_9BASI|nr:Molybdopterin binding protein [Pseudomicrostroma glucosiphilum]PWN18450.1 Molybdopterin binding protein [Pseudomicrostroma glucosiphilum]
MASSSQQAMPKFAMSDVSKHNQPLGPGKYVQTAGCIIIGDEVLNGKTKDSNSNYFAQFCFNRGIDLKRIEVIADDEEEIAEAVRRFGEKYDFTVTSGGIGPTFDDITYESIAKAFGAEPLEYHDETLRRMAEMQKGRSQSREQTEEMVTARKRMALFPSSKGSGAAQVEVIHPTESLWVPVVRINGRICILPGVPRLFEALLDGMEPYVPIDTSKPRPHRMLVHTKLPESSIAPYLEKLNTRCKQENIRLGSYPKFQGGVDVSLIGDDLKRLQELGEEVEKELDAKIVESGKLGE